MGEAPRRPIQPVKAIQPKNTSYGPIPLTGDSTDTDYDRLYGPLMEMSELRHFLGIFDDASEDGLLTRFAGMAVAKIEDVIGMGLLSRPVRDSYANLGSRHALSQRGEISGMSVSIYGADLSLAELPTRILADQTESPPIAILPDLASAPELSAFHMHPVQIDYTCALEKKAAETVRTAFTYLVSTYYYDRGEISKGDDRHVYRALAPHRPMAA